MASESDHFDFSLSDSNQNPLDSYSLFQQPDRQFSSFISFLFSHSFLQSTPGINPPLSSPFFAHFLFSSPHIDDEPLYVNAKQYFRILKRRVARARMEEVHRLSRQRKVSFTMLNFISLFLNL